MKVLTRKLWYTNARGSHDNTSVHGSPFPPRVSSPLQHKQPSASQHQIRDEQMRGKRDSRRGVGTGEKEENSRSGNWGEGRKKTHDSKVERGRASPAPSTRRRSNAAHASSSAGTIAVDGLQPRFPPPPSSGLPPRTAARPAIPDAASLPRVRPSRCVSTLAFRWF
jgi:hypothetical protein